MALQTQVKHLADSVTKRRHKTDKKGDKTRCDDTKKQKGREQWQLTPPAAGKPTTKMVNGHTFHWCARPHGQDAVPLWGVHEPSLHRDAFKRAKTGATPPEAEAVLAHAATLTGSALNEDTDDEGEG